MEYNFITSIVKLLQELGTGWVRLFNCTIHFHLVNEFRNKFPFFFCAELENTHESVIDNVR